MKRPSVLLIAFCSSMGLATAAPSAAAQAPEAKVEFHYRLGPKEPKINVNKDSPIVLRPNSGLAVELLVKNTEGNKFANGLNEVTVKLMRVDGADPVMLTAAKLDKVDKLLPGNEAHLVFAADKALAELGKGSPPPMQLWLDAKLGKVAVKTFKLDLGVQYDHPENYLNVDKAHFDSTTGRISFFVSLKKDFVGPPCKVELVLDNDYIPGLKNVKNETLVRKLVNIGQGLELFADLEFEGAAGGPANARVFLNVDGFARAFEFMPRFDLTGFIRPAVLGNDVAVRFRTKRYVVPDKKNPLIVTLEIDGRPIDQPAQVEFAINRSENNKDENQFEIVPPGGLRRGLRDVTLGIDADKKGDLFITMNVADWRVPLDTAAMSGKRWLRARVLDDTGKKELTVSSEALRLLESGRGGLAPLILERGTNQVFAPVTIDDTAAVDLKFLNLPPTITAGKDLKVIVTAKERPESRYAPIDKVKFYLGKKTLDRKIEAEVVEVTEPKDGPWAAVLRMPDKVGKCEIAVQFWTCTDKVSAASNFIMVEPPGAVLTTITGTTVGIDKKSWPGMTVKLLDAKGESKGEQESDDKGVFIFKDVAPGPYVIDATRSIPRLYGQKKVTVLPGMEKLPVVVEIKRK